MQFELLSTKSESPSILGFRITQVYSVNKLRPEDKGESIVESLIRSYEFSDTHAYSKNEKLDQRNRKKFYQVGFANRGPIDISQLEVSDSSQLSFSELDHIIREQKMKENDWGNDLPVFQQLYDRTYTEINNSELIKHPVFYLDVDKLLTHKVIKDSGYGYYLMILIFVDHEQKVYVFDHGGD